MFTLPNLPYAHNALEPHIDATTMTIHHGKHHAAYIKNLDSSPWFKNPKLVVIKTGEKNKQRNSDFTLQVTNLTKATPDQAAASSGRTPGPCAPGPACADVAHDAAADQVLPHAQGAASHPDRRPDHQPGPGGRHGHRRQGDAECGKSGGQKFGAFFVGDTIQGYVNRSLKGLK